MIFIPNSQVPGNNRWVTADTNFTRGGLNSTDVRSFLALWFYFLLQKKTQCPSGGHRIEPSRQYLEMFFSGI